MGLAADRQEYGQRSNVQARCSALKKDGRNGGGTLWGVRAPVVDRVIHVIETDRCNFLKWLGRKSSLNRCLGGTIEFAISGWFGYVPKVA